MILIFLWLSGAIIPFMWGITSIMDGSVAFGWFLTIIGAAVFFVPLILMVLTVIRQNQAAKSQKLLEFYKECLRQNIKDLSTPANIAKVELIAKQFGLSKRNVQELFATGKAMCQQQEDNEEQERLKQIRDDEEYTYRKLTKYSNLFGREKRIAMLTDKRNEWLQSSKSARLVQKALVNASIQKEHDWATHGGLAAGVAGGAAGVAVAMDVQRKNAAIREQNAANLKAISPAYQSLGASASDARKCADRKSVV